VLLLEDSNESKFPLPLEQLSSIRSISQKSRTLMHGLMVGNSKGFKGKAEVGGDDVWFADATDAAESYIPPR
jgi:hypothetical protein